MTWFNGPDLLLLILALIISLIVYLRVRSLPKRDLEQERIDREEAELIEASQRDWDAFRKRVEGMRNDFE